MSKYVYLLSFMVLSLGLAAQETFFRVYDRPQDERAYNFIQNGDQGYLILGKSSKYMSDGLLLRKVALDGTEIWEKHENVPVWGLANNICVDAEENIVLLMNERIDNVSHIVLKKLDQSGNELSSTNIIAGGDATGIAETEDGYLITGSAPPLSGDSSLIAKVDKELNLLWEKHYYPTTMASQRTTAYDALAFGNHYYVLGYYYGSPGYGVDHKSYLMKIDQKGNPIWTKNFDTHIQQYYGSLIASSGGHLVIHGSYTDPEVHSLFRSSIICLDEDGTILWENEMAQDQRTLWGEDLVEASDGGFISCGGMWKNQGPTDIYLRKINAKGEHLWLKVIDRTYRDYASQLLLDEKDYILCTGYSLGNERYPNFFMMKTDPDGNFQGVEEVSDNASIKVFPNPVRGGWCRVELRDMMAAEKMAVELIDLSGRVVYHLDYHWDGMSNACDLNLNDLPSGFYTLQVKATSGVLSHKMVIP